MLIPVDVRNGNWFVFFFFHHVRIFNNNNNNNNSNSNSNKRYRVLYRVLLIFNQSDDLWKATNKDGRLWSTPTLDRFFVSKIVEIFLLFFCWIGFFFQPSNEAALISLTRVSFIDYSMLMIEGPTNEREKKQTNEQTNKKLLFFCFKQQQICFLAVSLLWQNVIFIPRCRDRFFMFSVGLLLNRYPFLSSVFSFFRFFCFSLVLSWMAVSIQVMNCMFFFNVP